MVGLLDWLTEGNAGSLFGSSDPMGNPTGMQGPMPTAAPAPTRQMPPVQQTGMDAPSLADPATQAMPGGQGAGPMPPNPMTDAMPGGQGGPAPAPPPVPLPQPRPAAADMPPPNATANPSALPPPGAPTSLAPPAAMPPKESLPPQQGGMMEQVASQGILGRALGLSPNTSNRLRSSLAAGLKSVPENSTKFGLAAASGSAGSAMEGGTKRDDTTYDQKIKALQQAVAAKSAGDKQAYNMAYVKYLGQKLKSDQDAAASGGKKSGAWNKPDSQKFIDAMNAMNKDRRIVASQKALEGAIRDGDPKRIAQLQAQHDALTTQAKTEYLTGVGLDPKQIEFNMKNPPGTQQNPFKVTSKEDLERYVKPGQAYINPKDNQVYIRNGEGGGAPDAGTSSATPSVQPAAPANPMNPGQGTLPADDNED